MPIVFEEVSGEIVPERAAEPRDAAESSRVPGEDASERLRRDLEMMRERQQRLIAD
jgi:hypothetical protein